MQNASFRQSWQDRIEIAGAGIPASTAAAYRYGPKLPKPCVHPLCTPAGHRLTGFEMSDHVWHRGLWFTIKFVNKTNFWEENEPPFGVQRSAEEPRCELISADAVRVTHLLDWTSGPTGLALRERRTMVFRSLDRDVSAIDWTSELRAAQDLTLDRTPYTTWGGYGGLSFRAARELHDVSFLLPSGETVPQLAGQPHDWTVMQAAVDGGPGRRVSLGMIDHPTNPRSPSPWYDKSNPGFSYMNAAFLFHEPMSLARESSLRFRYRVVYRDGTWTRDEFAALAGAFRQSDEIQG